MLKEGVDNWYGSVSQGHVDHVQLQEQGWGHCKVAVHVPGSTLGEETKVVISRKDHNPYVP